MIAMIEGEKVRVKSLKRRRRENIVMGRIEGGRERERVDVKGSW